MVVSCWLVNLDSFGDDGTCEVGGVSRMIDSSCNERSGVVYMWEETRVCSFSCNQKKDERALRSDAPSLAATRAFSRARSAVEYCAMREEDARGLKDAQLWILVPPSVGNFGVPLKWSPVTHRSAGLLGDLRAEDL